jgi:hypothetical protein
VNFPDRRTRKGGPIAWPPPSPDLTLLNFFILGLCERPSVQPKSGCAGWTQSTDHCSNCRHLISRLARGGTYAELQLTPTVKCFAPNNFPTCV